MAADALVVGMATKAPAANAPATASLMKSLMM
jgi:hypothetical protein